jgi:hypothetical protein
VEEMRFNHQQENRIAETEECMRREWLRLVELVSLCSVGLQLHFLTTTTTRIIGCSESPSERLLPSTVALLTVTDSDKQSINSFSCE